MQHSETRKLVPGAKYAVLLLHGIAGSPNQFRRLIPLEELVPQDWSVYNLRYPGHGGDVRDFGRSVMKQWRSHAREAFLELSENHEKVLVVGHSMGTLFAVQLAVEFPEKVAVLFLLNVPMRPMPRLFFMVNGLRLAFNRIRQDHPEEACFQIACGVNPTALVWRYIPWIPRILELFREIHRTEKLLVNLTVPCVAWQSRKDDLVSNLSAPVLRESGVMDVHELPESTHFYYAPKDKASVCEAFENEIKKISC
jgi:esterase/lipase